VEVGDGCRARERVQETGKGQSLLEGKEEKRRVKKEENEIRARTLNKNQGITASGTAEKKETDAGSPSTATALGRRKGKNFDERTVELIVTEKHREKLKNDPIHSAKGRKY